MNTLGYTMVRHCDNVTTQSREQEQQGGETLVVLVVKLQQRSAKHGECSA